MNLMTFASLALAWLLGCLIADALWPRDGDARRDPVLLLPLGALVGFGVSSVLFFAASLVSPNPALVAGGLEMAGIAWAFGWRMRRPGAAAAAVNHSPMTWLDWALTTVCAQAAIAAAIVGWRAYRIEPYGGWDGWAIWNLHARFMLRGGTEWPALLAAPSLSWTHPDYPWLVPASVARVWAWSGREAAGAAALVSGLFAVAAVALLAAAVRVVRGRTLALLAALLLAGTPFFVTFSTNQHADIPLAGFILATLVLLALGRHAALAGLCAGLAAWTKNEGILFAVAATLLLALHQWRQRSLRATLPFLAGLAAGGLPVLCFKIAMAPPGDLLAGSFTARLAQLFEAARHQTILAALGRDLRQFGEWSTLPYLAMAVPFAAWRWRRKLTGPERLMPWAVLIMLTGFYLVYVLTPQDLKWHLDTSLVRLLLQLWPAALFCWALAVPYRETRPTIPPPRQHRTWLVFIVANALAGLGVVGALSGQLAANELAVRRQGVDVVAVTLGEGWYGIERQGRDRWAWSSGNAALQLETDAQDAPSRATLRFALRSLKARTVTIRQDDRVVWQGQLGDQFVDVVLRDLVISGGKITLRFSTDSPGVSESPADPGARQLAYGIYRVKLE